MPGNLLLDVAWKRRFACRRTGKPIVLETDAPLAIRLFGPFEGRLHGEPLPRLRTRKGQWLLALLALRAGQEVERSWLAGTLWPESDEPQAFGSLRKSLADLRSALGEAGEPRHPSAASPPLGVPWVPDAQRQRRGPGPGGRLLSPTVHTLSLDATGMAIDVTAFDGAIARGDGAALEEAVGLYRGPLLEGCSEEWAFQERQVREQSYLGALERLAGQTLECGDGAAGGESPERSSHRRRRPSGTVKVPTPATGPRACERGARGSRSRTWRKRSRIARWTGSCGNDGK